MSNPFFDIGVRKQDEAKTKEEAKKELDFSCSKCNKVYNYKGCIEAQCPVLQAHNAKIALIEVTKNRKPLIGRRTKTIPLPKRVYETTPEKAIEKRIQISITKTAVNANKSAKFVFNNLAAAVRAKDYNEARKYVDELHETGEHRKLAKVVLPLLEELQKNQISTK